MLTPVFTIVDAILLFTSGALTAAFIFEIAKLVIYNKIIKAVKRED